MVKYILIFLLINIWKIGEAQKDQDEKSKLQLKTLTIVSEERDGLKRLLRSASIYGINLKVLGIGEWVLPKQLQTYLIRNEGLWQKISIFAKEVEKYKNDENAIILMVDGFDVVFCAGEEEILAKFLDFKANVVFGAEVRGYDGNIEPNERYKNLNSGMIIGYASILHDIFSAYKRNASVLNDQTYYSSLYLTDQIRRFYNIKLDHKAILVQNLLFAEEDVELEFLEDDTRLVNKVLKTRPSIVHGNGYLGMLTINALGNYLAKSWNPNHGCMACHEGTIHLKHIMTWDYPKVLMGIFIKGKTPFLEEMLRKAVEQNYPKERIFLYVVNVVPEYNQMLRQWLLLQENEYYKIKFISSTENVTTAEGKQAALKLCIEISCDFFFNIEGTVQLDNSNVLHLLISYNRSIIAPVISEVTKLLSTFWGAIDGNNYVRSFDYVDIVIGKTRGIWNVPFITYSYLIHRSAIKNTLAELNYLTFRDNDYRGPGDMILCLNNLANETFMYAVNLDDYGYLISPLEEQHAHFQNELWHVGSNFLEWGRRYIHQDYRPNSFKKVIKDVYTFPVFTKLFCEDVVKVLPEQILTENNQTYVSLESLQYEKEWKETFVKYIKPTIDFILKGKRVSASLRKSFIHKYEPGNSFDAENFSPYLRISLTQNTRKSQGEDICFQTCSLPESAVGWVTIFLVNRPNSWKETSHFELISLFELE